MSQQDDGDWQQVHTKPKAAAGTRGKKAAMTRQPRFPHAPPGKPPAHQDKAAPPPAQPRRFSSSVASHDSDDSSSEDEEGIEPPPEHFDAPVLVLCPFPHVRLIGVNEAGEEQYEQEGMHAFTKPRPLVEHLETRHQWRFRNLHHMYAGLQAYLDYWARALKAHKEQEQALPEGVQEEKDEKGAVLLRIVDPDKCGDDMRLRKKIQTEKLNEILKIQEHERQHAALLKRKCLFCKMVCDNRAVLFRHMFVEHNFNIGLADNLVQVNEFLDILENKLASLQCLYCEKVFTTTVVLRKHMRKKKHFKISPRNRIYDRFYVINYLEPGKNWEDWEAEQHESDLEKKKHKKKKQQQQADDDDDDHDSFEDWDEPDYEPTQCLFDDHVEDSPEKIDQHMVAQHGFSLLDKKKQLGLDFYKTIALINWIRHHTLQHKCFVHADLEPFVELKELLVHLETEGCWHKLPESTDALYQDPQYLFPTVENDPLLMYVDLEDGELEESEQAKQAALELMEKLKLGI